MINRTTVIVAHRLSTVRNAATIAVIHQGKLVEKGKNTFSLKLTSSWVDYFFSLIYFSSFHWHNLYSYY